MIFLPLVTVLVTSSVLLPPAPPVVMDYLVVDDANHRLWAPAGNTGRVDVIDVRTLQVTAIEHFATALSQRPGRPDMLRGPSSATVGAGEVWVGNRGDQSVCAFDAKTLAKRRCERLASSPDGLAWVGATNELWVTTPRAQSLTIVKAGASPAPIAVDGSPEGYAVDEARGRFYTNLEDHDATLAVDVRTRKVVARYPDGCGGDGPRGLALDARRQLLVVACSDGAVVLDVGHDGKALTRLHTGAGVDNIAYWAKGQLVYIASGKAAELTIAKLDDKGQLPVVATAPTGAGARVVVADDAGTAYVADSAAGRIVVVHAPK